MCRPGPKRSGPSATPLSRGPFAPLTDVTGLPIGDPKQLGLIADGQFDWVNDSSNLEHPASSMCQILTIQEVSCKSCTVSMLAIATHFRTVGSRCQFQNRQGLVQKSCMKQAP